MNALEKLQQSAPKKQPKMPTTKDAGWEFTDLKSFSWDNYPLAKASMIRANAGEGSAVIKPGPGTLLARDGVIQNLPKEQIDGVTVSSLAKLDESELHGLGRLVSADGDVFTAFNTKNIHDGVFVHIGKDASPKAPVMITHVQTQAETTATWRSLIVVEAGANATVVEQFLSADPELDACMIPVTEIILGEGATLKYLCAQTLSEKTWLFGSQRAELARDSHLHWVGLGLGSRRGKLRMETDLRGQGSRAVVTGAYVAEHEQHLDYETTQEHYAPNTSSDLSFRGILRDHAHSVWSGMIRVDPGAQKTDAFQESRNLLLSPNAHADSIPGLEIEADDVRCTHAATISQVDKNQLFYLESRGLPREEAEAMIISGFLETTVTRLEDWGTLQRPVRLALTQALQRGDSTALLGSD